MATGLDAQQTIFASNPDDRRAFEALEEHFFLEGDWESLASVYRARLEAPSIAEDDGQRAPLLFRLGQILEERILDLDGATETYWILARLDPTNRPALRQLRGIHERRAQWDMVLQIAELESATTMPPYERAAFESELGRTWQQHLGDPGEAQAAYERALKADPDFPAALEGLAEIHHEAGELRDASLILERLTDRLRGPERAPVWIRLGALYAGPLEEPERARQCFTSALEDDPFQAPAVEWSLLLATAAEDWPAVSDLLESRFDLASGARSRAAIAVEASQIQLNHLDSPASARAWVDRALELGADEAAVLLAASDVERADGDRDALLTHLDQLITVAGRHTPRGALIEAAELHADFGHRERALETIRQAADRGCGTDASMLELHARLLREGDAKQELAEVLETLTALEAGVDAETRVQRLEELATLQEDDLSDSDAARTTWRRAFDLDPGNASSLDALDRLYAKDEDWDSLRDVLESAVRAGGDETPATVNARLGEVFLDGFDDDTQALSHFERALASDANSPKALAGLRRIADASGDPDLLLDICEREARDCRDATLMAELAKTALPILEERNEREEALEWATRWSTVASESAAAFLKRAELEAALERPEAEVESRRALARLQTGGDRGHTLERQAALHRSLGQDVEAASALELAFEALPDSSEILDSLCDVYRELGYPQQLARALRAVADRLPPSEQAEPLEELASLLQDPIGDLDTAIVVRWRLVDLPDCPAEAPGKLEALLEMAGRYAELCQLFETQRQRLGDESSEAFELDLRRATLLLDSLGHCDEAAEIFAGLHERHPDSDEILDLLERALRGGDDATGLCSLLERRAGWESNEERKAAFHLERATILEETLGESHAACDLYEEILQELGDTPAADTADHRLEALLEATGQWARLRDRLIERAASFPEDEEAALREQIATICRDRLHDTPACAEQLERIAELKSDRVHVWQQLADIYANELDRPADWLRVVEAELDSEPDAEREFNLRVNAARLCLDDARCPDGHDASEAYAHYERVLSLDPTHAEAAEVLAMHFASAGRSQDTARILSARLEHLGDDTTADANDLRIRLATIYADALEDDERARPLFEEAYAQLGVSDRLSTPLAELYERVEDHAALASLSSAVLNAGGNEETLLVWRVRLGKSEHALDHLEEAAVAYRAALVQARDDREIEDALIDIYQRVDETEPLAELLEKRLPYAHADEAIDLRFRLARLHADGRNEPAVGLRHLEWILDAHPQHRDAFDYALELAERMDDPSQIVSLIDRMLGTSLPDEERAELLERRGVLQADVLGNPEQAVLAFREALSFDRQRESARCALRAQLERLERWPAVLDCLFVEAIESGTERREVLFEEAAELSWSRINPDASLPWLARLRELRPEDPELFARIAEVHRRAGRFEAALRALDQELSLRTDDEERKDLYLQRARLLERELHAPARAIQAYRDALALSDDGVDILEELDRLYDLMGRPADRAEILEIRVEALEGEAAQALRKTLAALYCIELSKPERAVPHLQANASLCEDPAEEMAALGALEAALRASGHVAEWIVVAERELTLIATDPEIAANTPEEFQRYLREELARTWDEVMGDGEQALSHLRVLCADDDQAAGPLGEKLRGLLRRLGKRTELASALTNHAERGGASAAEWLELAQLREENLLDLTGARDAYHRAGEDMALRLAATRGVRRTSERLRDWEAMAGALEQEYALEDALDRSQRTALARRLGDLCWQRLGSGERAASAYQLALDLDPNDLDALRATTTVHEACSNYADAVTLYRRELKILSDDDESGDRPRDIWLRLATLCAEHCNDADGALKAYAEAALLERLSAPDELRYARLFEETRDTDGFAETFGRWCDREDSGSSVRDHLELAEALIATKKTDAARARCERATAVAPESSEAWALRAKLDQNAEAWEEAATAYERAADHATGLDAARSLVNAASCIESLDADRAHGFLVRACDLDPGNLDAHVARTRVAASLGHTEETEREAERALEIAHSETLASETRLEIAVLGGAAARELGHRDRSRALFEAALEVDADHVESLEGVARAHFEDGDFRAARTPLERRLDLPGEDPHRAEHLSIVARGLEAEEHLDAAWARYEEALDIDTALEEAHEGLVRVHERAGRTEDALTSLERWSKASTDTETSARAAYRAAEHALALDRKEVALRLLESATEAASDLTPAWVLLCELASDRLPEEEVRALCDRALDAIEPDELSASISLRAARLAEIAGDLPQARIRYGEAARWDPRASEAVLCESRLARREGDWVDADAVLSRFLDVHPDPDSPTLAHVHLERGRLLSGPLEDFDASIVSYEAALARQPDLGVARTALASLLTHAPERWREAVALHREILDASPTNAPSLRALIRIAEERRQTDIADGGRVLLLALGVATPQEQETGTSTLRFPIHPGPPMADISSERLRRIAHQIAEELSDVLAGAAPPRVSSEDSDLDEALRQISALEDELSAPGLARLETDDRAALFSALGGLFLDPGGNGADSPYRAPLDEAIGRWSRRKVRRIVEETTMTEIESIDQAAWGEELRAMAAAQVVDRNGGELKHVLRALLVLDPDSAESPAFEGAEIATLAASSDAARRLLTRITTQLCDRLDGGR